MNSVKYIVVIIEYLMLNNSKAKLLLHLDIKEICPHILLQQVMVHFCLNQLRERCPEVCFAKLF